MVEANAGQIEGLDARGFFGFDPAFDICEAVAVSEAMCEMFEVEVEGLRECAGRCRAVFHEARHHVYGCSVGRDRKLSAVSVEDGPA